MENKIISKFKVGEKILFCDCGFWTPGVVTGFEKNFVGRTLINIRDEFGSDLVYYEHEVRTRPVIDKFENEYFFLSNFYMCPVEIDGIKYTNSEAAFHAQKCLERKGEFAYLNPNEAKRLGRSVNLRTDWDDIRIAVMFNICLAKFVQNPDLAKKLIKTEDAELIEGNTWNDKFWGVCNGVGENNLGKILMQIRFNFKTGNAQTNPESLLKSYCTKKQDGEIKSSIYKMSSLFFFYILLLYQTLQYR